MKDIGEADSYIRKPTLTIIIPLRVTDARSDLVERVRHTFADPTLPDSASILVVDDGSPAHHRRRLEEAIHGTSINLVSTGAKHYQLFNQSRARNYGAQRTKTDFVMFLDADLLPYSGFFADLYAEINLLMERGFVNDFLMIPCIYLTVAGYRKFLSLPVELQKSRMINAVLEHDQGYVEKFSTGTSVIVVRRDYYLVRGGHDERFAGWGFEDYEFICRLIRRSRQFPLPEDWLNSDGNFMSIKKYKGWKAVYRLHGEWMARKGVWLFHAPHAIEAGLHSTKDQNWNFFRERLRQDSQGDEEPHALADLTSGTSLIMTQNPFTFGREIAPYWGQVIFAKSSELHSVPKLQFFIKKNKVSRIVFGNPYKDVLTLKIYNWCRKTNFPFYVCERGALPDSVFHDNTGFLSDSKKYHRKIWERQLSASELALVNDYISSIRCGSHMLETQAARIDLYKVKQRLGIESKKKILLVPFQQPNDTVVRFFSGATASFGAFFDLVSALPDHLGPDWVVVYKKHPAEDELANIPGAINADNYNINDLIEICDAALVMNSGTGLLAMMSGKPVYITANCWYSDKDMNVTFTDKSSLDPSFVASKIKEKFELNYDLVLQFIYYLRFEFYSFGAQRQRRVRYPDGTPITATTHIDFYEVRGFTEMPTFYRRKFSPISKSSPIFDRYDLSSLSAGASVSAVGTAQGSQLLINTNKFGPENGVAARKNREEKTMLSRQNAKFEKLRRDPYSFFSDAKFSLLRPLRVFFQPTRVG